MVEFDDIRDRAECDEVEQRGELGFGASARRREPLAVAQLGAQRQHHVKHHADAGQAFAREAAGGQIRVDDTVGRRQFVTRQVVVGDQRGDAELPGAGDALRRWRCRCRR
jgi:hypothetical protein